MEQNDVLFIDEIHRLSNSVEEVLYAAMEDYVLDILIGEGPAAKSVRIELSPFTLIGATTRLGLISNPLRERFGIPITLDFYKIEDLTMVVKKAAHELAIIIDDASAKEIAKRSREHQELQIDYFAEYTIILYTINWMVLMLILRGCLCKNLK